jgi:phage shock protein PspC (stress-responsive transcriptional regulator)
MHAHDLNSIEQLDALLAEGKISEEDYETLRSAMERNEEADTTTDHGAAAGPLRRSTRDRVIGGVCGGIAEHLGVDPLLVRISAVLIALFSAGTAIILYVVLYIVLEGNAEQNHARPLGRLSDLRIGFSWRFAAFVIALWLVHTAFITYLFPSVFLFLNEAGARFNPLIRLMFKLRYYTANFAFLYCQVVLLCCLILGYALLPPGGKERKVTVRIIAYGFLFLLLTYSIALAFPLPRMTAG